MPILYIIWLIAGLVGLSLCFDIVYIVLGPVWAFLSLLIFPVLLGIAPWYALFAWGDWLPLLVVYGGGLGPGILMGLFSKESY
ncbi:MAG: hypothetical protein H8E55_44455 [Pelagibacterales bacterium]|nr:hypothetical protein [Pelagibacterales bacterium]